VISRLARGESIVIVDVRGADEYAAGHVDGAIHVPIESLTAELERFRAATRVVTVCEKGGGRSERAAQLLRESGIATARSLCGGTSAWKEQHLQGVPA